MTTALLLVAIISLASLWLVGRIRAAAKNRQWTKQMLAQFEQMEAAMNASDLQYEKSMRELQRLEPKPKPKTLPQPKSTKTQKRIRQPRPNSTSPDAHSAISKALSTSMSQPPPNAVVPNTPSKASVKKVNKSLVNRETESANSVVPHVLPSAKTPNIPKPSKTMAPPKPLPPSLDLVPQPPRHSILSRCSLVLKFTATVIAVVTRPIWSIPRTFGNFFFRQKPPTINQATLPPQNRVA